MKLLFCSVLSVSVLISCNIINPDEQLPAYVSIEDFSFTTTTGQGTASHQITDLWVYANADIQGVYDLPVSAPVLREGAHTIRVYAGIKNNGVGSERIRYPFYAPFDTVVDLAPKQSHLITPRFTYFSNAVIDATRDFETTNTFQEGGANSGGVFEIITNPSIAFEGNKCGKAFVGSNGHLQFVEDNTIELESGNTIFLELNYSCNNTFAVGVFSSAAGDVDKFPIVYITPTTGDPAGGPVWNKIYIDLGLAAMANPGADFHRLYIECGPSEAASPVIYLDNMKIVKWP